MGTNYYVRTNHCEHCNRHETQHIGKSSWGWAFSFRGYRYDGLCSWQDWKTYLKDKVIIDEYDEIKPYDEFVNMIETVKAPDYTREDGHTNKVHNTEGRKDGWYNPEYDWDDPQGYSFTSREFS
jgi:hypothetical protein